MNFEFNKNIITGILNTEKSCFLRDNNGVIVLSITKGSNKSDIQKESEKVFGVKVESVNVMRCTKIGKMFKGKRGGNKIIKKAYIKISRDSGFDFSKLQQ
jgi:ribosomal protein L23